MACSLSDVGVQHVLAERRTWRVKKKKKSQDWRKWVTGCKNNWSSLRGDVVSCRNAWKKWTKKNQNGRTKVTKMFGSSSDLPWTCIRLLLQFHELDLVANYILQQKMKVQFWNVRFFLGLHSVLANCVMVLPGSEIIQLRHSRISRKERHKLAQRFGHFRCAHA